MEKNEDTQTAGCAALIFLFLAVILIVAMVFLNRGCNKVIYEIEELSIEYTSYLGKRTVIDGDTLTITSYKLFKDSFTLSNGSVIHYEVAKKFLLEE